MNFINVYNIVQKNTIQIIKIKYVNLGNLNVKLNNVFFKIYLTTCMNVDLVVTKIHIMEEISLIMLAYLYIK